MLLESTTEPLAETFSGGLSARPAQPGSNEVHHCDGHEREFDLDKHHCTLMTSESALSCLGYRMA